jgi:hypothetical protein
VGHLFGNISRFAIEVGDFLNETKQFRRVDVWAADHWLTCDDNHAFVSPFIGKLKGTLGRLLRDPQYSVKMGRPFPELSPGENHKRLCADAVTDNTEYLYYSFMDWGETTDKVRMHLFREGGTAFLPFSFWRETHHDSSELGQVFVAELTEWELLSVLHEAAWAMMWDWANGSK